MFVTIITAKVDDLRGSEVAIRRGDVIDRAASIM